mgnify:CR=1 FL=1
MDRLSCERSEGVEQSTVGTTRVHPHRGVSIVLGFTEVDLSVRGSFFDVHVGGLCKSCRGLHLSWLLEMPVKSTTIQIRLQMISSAGEKHIWSWLDGD